MPKKSQYSPGRLRFIAWIQVLKQIGSLGQARITWLGAPPPTGKLLRFEVSIAATWKWDYDSKAGKDVDDGAHGAWCLRSNVLAVLRQLGGDDISGAAWWPAGAKSNLSDRFEEAVDG